jgi:hypothetical protein
VVFLHANKNLMRVDENEIICYNINISNEQRRHKMKTDVKEKYINAISRALPGKNFEAYEDNKTNTVTFLVYMREQVGLSNEEKKALGREFGDENFIPAFNGKFYRNNVYASHCSTMGKKYCNTFFKIKI